MMKILKIIKEKIKLRTLIILIVLLVFNSYAWFIYATKVSGTLSARVASWNIQFNAGEEEFVTYLDFDVDRIYPGMETYTKTVVARNRGETTASLTFEIKSVKILEQQYEVDENTTSADLLEMVENDFPFHILVTIDNDELEAEEGTGTFTISLQWPFEANNDELDTEWGEKAYEYHSIHPYETSINMELEIKAVQQ